MSVHIPLAGKPGGEVESAVDIGHLPMQVWQENNIKVRRDQSFLCFIMPVAFPEHEVHGHRFERRAEQLAASECWELLGGERQGFLPHVRVHFNSVSWHGAGSADGGERNDRPILDPEIAFGYIFDDTGMANLTLPGSGFSFQVPGSDEGRHVEADITGAQLGIFRLGVGFVSLEIRPRSDELPDWLDTLHFLRFYRRRGKGLRCAGRDRALQIEDFMAPVLATARLDGEGLPFGDPDNGKPQPYKRRIKELYTRGEFLTHVALFVDGVPSDDQPRLLYTVLNRFRSASLAAPPEDDGESSWCLPYQEGQQFLNSIEGSAFVAFDAGRTQFDLNTLPSHLRTTYFTLFLLALLQRFALDQLSETVALSTGRVLTESERGHARGELERITSLDGRLLDFTGRCYFVQVSQTAHHHRYYARLREVNQIDDRYREVTEEIHALRAHAASRVSVEQERASLRVAGALMVITCVLLPLQVIEALFAAKLPELPGIRELSPIWSAATAGFVLLITIAAALVILKGNWLARRQRR
jgi:hypothetical protein